MEVWNAAVALREAESALRAGPAAPRLASDQLDLAELRYHNGLNTVLDVLNAEAVLAAAEVGGRGGSLRLQHSPCRVLRARGRGFDRWPQLLGEEDIGSASGNGAVGHTRIAGIHR